MSFWDGNDLCDIWQIDLPRVVSDVFSVDSEFSASVYEALSDSDSLVVTCLQICQEWAEI